MEIRKVTIIGGGVLGSQIAFQSAYVGAQVTIWLRSQSSITRTLPKLENLKNKYLEDIEVMDSKEGKNLSSWCNGIAQFDEFKAKECKENVERAMKEIKIELDLAKAVKDADLVIESLAEDVEQKIEFFKKVAPLLDEKTILATNSSTLLPSKFAKYTGRANKFLSFHFANIIWKNNIAEIMRQSHTDDESFNSVIEYAKFMKMIPLPINKEKSGYLLNSMLVPLLFSGLDLYVNGISDPQSIDTAWTKGTGAPKGPFQILDTVGITTAYNIVQMYVKIPSFLAPYNFKGMNKLLKKMIDENKLGTSTGEGFYKYN